MFGGRYLSLQVPSWNPWRFRSVEPQQRYQESTILLIGLIWGIGYLAAKGIWKLNPAEILRKDA